MAIYWSFPRHSEPMVSRNGNEQTKPNIVADYDKFMSGGDRADNWFHSTIIDQMKFFFHSLDICIWNGCWFCKKATKKVSCHNL